MDVDRVRDLIAERMKASPAAMKRLHAATAAADWDARMDEYRRQLAEELGMDAGDGRLEAIALATAIRGYVADPKGEMDLSHAGAHGGMRQAPEVLKPEDLAGLEPWLLHPDLDQYLTQCLVPGGYIASGIPVHDLPTIRASIVEGCSPGGFILGFGYLVIAKGIGGDEVCVETDGRVHWAGHETFASSITYQHPETGALEDWEYTPENVRRALIPLSDSFETFLIAFLSDELQDRLQALD
jgi:hypothetical protein